jgi:SP family myo-inositol transporter-like MFS transporter 13
MTRGSWGRKPVILVASFLFAAGSAVLAAATGLAMLLIGRVAVGLAIGT